MLILCRQPDQKIILTDPRHPNERVVIMVTRIKGSEKVWLGFEAPPHIAVDREEVRESKQRDRAAALATAAEGGRT